MYLVFLAKHRSAEENTFSMYTVISTSGMVPKVKSEQRFQPDTCLVARGIAGVLFTAVHTSTGLCPLGFFWQ